MSLFGFRRLPGASRRYEAVNSPDYAPGITLSRRQFDAYVGRLGGRKPLPGAAQLIEAEEQLARAQADLDRLAARLAREGSEFEREALAQARESLGARARATASARLRRERQAAGQRRYNTLLKTFRQAREDQGEELTYAEARSDPEFAAMRKALRTRDKDAMREFFLRYGQTFRELYNDLYGRTVGEVTNPRGERFTRIVLPSGRSLLRRKAA